MSKKPDITTIATGYYGRQALNDNFEKIRDQFDNTLSLDGSVPNAMQADLDLNGYALANVADIRDTSGNNILALTKSYSSAAQVAKTTVEVLYDNFDDTYLGAKAADPTVDNDGDPINVGALYFNTTLNQLRIYTGPTNGFSLAIASAQAGIAPIIEGGTGADNAEDARTNLDVDQAGTALALSIALG